MLHFKKQIALRGATSGFNQILKQLKEIKKQHLKKMNTVIFLVISCENESLYCDVFDWR
jgi:hypothetical protein